MIRGVFALLVGLALVAAEVRGQEPVVHTPEGVLLDFQDAELQVVITALAEAAGMNVVYGSLPARAVTLRMSTPVPRSELRALLASFADVHGLTVDERDGFVRVGVAEPVPETPIEARRLFAYRLRHAEASRVAQTVSALFGSGTRTGQAPRGVDDGHRSDRVMRIPPLDPSRPAAGEPEAPPALPAEVLGEVQVVPDDLTNAIFVRSTPGDWEVIRQAIELLDLRPLQVLIEVVIVEVRRSSEYEVGISVGQVDSLSPVPHERIQPQLRGALGGDFLLTIQRPGGLDVDAAISLLSATGDVRILSRPLVLAQNNQEARILVGSERPFVQVFRSLPTDAAIRDQIVQYREVGTSLTILPTINPDGYVNLDVRQEVSTATAETQFGAPVISTREAATRLFVRDGQTAVIGGLIDEIEDRSRSGVPILKDLPLVGYLFGTTRERKVHTELFLFLTPHIVATDEDTDAVRESVLERTRMPEPPPALRTAPDTVPPP